MLNRPYRLLILLGVVLFASLAARAQGTTVTLDPVVPVSGTAMTSGTSFTFTAHVFNSGTHAPITSGTVTFLDTNPNNVVQELGSAEIQMPTAGSPATVVTGQAVLHQQVGGIGTHTITATFGSGSKQIISNSQTVAIKPFYGSAATLASSGTPGSYTLSGVLSAFGSPQPTGTIKFTDTTNANVVIPPATLDPTAAVTSFAPVATTSVPYITQRAPAVGDFNNDGILDFVVPIQASSPTTPSSIAVLLGNGDGTYRPGIPISPPTMPAFVGSFNSAVAGDFNNDGNLDFAVLSTDPTDPIGIYLGDGTGQFPVPTFVTTGATNPQFLAAGDFNNDGILDLAISDQPGTGTVIVLLGSGGGSFGAPKPYSVPGTSLLFNIAVGDLDGDGNQDLVVSDDGGPDVAILYGDGTGDFSSQSIIPVPNNQSGSITIGDFNGDGKLDIAATDQLAKSIYVLMNQGSRTFSSPAATYSDPSGPYFLTSGDVNHDGKIDLVAANFNDGTVSVFLNSADGSGTFLPSSLYSVSVGGQATFALVGDLNGDNQIDIAAMVTNANPPPATDGLGILLAAQTTPFSAGPISIPVCQNVPASSHSITAMYSGDTNYSPSTASPSVSLMTTPIVPVTTGLALSLIPAAPAYGQQVQLVAVLTPSSTGSSSTNGALIKFMDGTTALGTAPLQNGTATLAVAPLAIGAHSLTASYAGDGCAFLSSVSNTVPINVAKSAVTVIVSVPATAVTGQNVTLTAAVQASITNQPTGTIMFQSNGALVGTSTLTNGAATFNTTTLPVGVDTITAIYSGDSIFAGATSTNTASITITAATTPPPPVLDFTLQVTSPTTINGNYGGSPNYTLLLTPTNAAGFPGSVQFSATTNKLLNATFMFSPDTIAANSGPSNVVLSATTYFSIQSREESAPVFKRLAPLSLCLLVPLCMLRRLRRQRHLLARAMTIVLLTVLGFVGASSLSGCGSGYAPFDYPITVTAISGHVTHTVTVIFHVGAVK